MVTTKNTNRSERVTNTPVTEPFEKLRLSFLVGRPTQVVHNPVSGVSAAQNELKRLEAAITGLKMDCRAEVAIVVAPAEGKLAGRCFPVSHSAQEAAIVISDIAALQEPRIIGLVYVVADRRTGAFEFWSKLFLRGREAETILDFAVADQVRTIMKGGTN